MRHERVVYECDRCHQESLSTMACAIRVESLGSGASSFTMHHVCSACAKELLGKIQHVSVAEVERRTIDSASWLTILELAGHPVAKCLQDVRNMRVPEDVPSVPHLFYRLLDAQVQTLPVDLVSKLLLNNEALLLDYEKAALQLVMHYRGKDTPVDQWRCDSQAVATITGRNPNGSLIIKHT